MIMSLVNLDLCQKQSIIQSGRYLTDTAAVLLYNTTILISTAKFISILCTKWNQVITHGKAFARTNQMSVDQFRSTFYVGITSISGSVISGIGTKYIRDGLQILLTGARLLHLNRQFHAGVCCTGPVIRYVVLQNLHGFIHIYHNTCLSGLHINAAAAV